VNVLTVAMPICFGDWTGGSQNLARDSMLLRGGPLEGNFAMQSTSTIMQNFSFLATLVPEIGWVPKLVKGTSPP